MPEHGPRKNRPLPVVAIGAVFVTVIRLRSRVVV